MSLHCSYLIYLLQCINGYFIKSKQHQKHFNNSTIIENVNYVLNMAFMNEIGNE